MHGHVGRNLVQDKANNGRGARHLTGHVYEWSTPSRRAESSASRRGTAPASTSFLFSMVSRAVLNMAGVGSVIALPWDFEGRKSSPSPLHSH